MSASNRNKFINEINKLQKFVESSNKIFDENDKFILYCRIAIQDKSKSYFKSKLRLTREANVITYLNTYINEVIDEQDQTTKDK